MIVGEVITGEQTIDVGIIAVTGEMTLLLDIDMLNILLNVIMQSVFVAPLYALLYGPVLPEAFHGSEALYGKALVRPNISC